MAARPLPRSSTRMQAATIGVLPVAELAARPRRTDSTSVCSRSWSLSPHLPRRRARDLGPGVAQPDGAVEHRFAGLRILVEAEVALPFELHRLRRIAA